MCVCTPNLETSLPLGQPGRSCLSQVGGFGENFQGRVVKPLAPEDFTYGSFYDVDLGKGRGC